MSYPYLLKAAKYTVIEKTAAELAGTYYEAGRVSGMTSKYKTARAFAKANLEKFIPKAIEILTSMLGRQDLPDLMKQEIYDALLERADEKNAAEYIKEPTANPMAPPKNMQIAKGSDFDWAGATGKNPFRKDN